MAFPPIHFLVCKRLLCPIAEVSSFILRHHVSLGCSVVSDNGQLSQPIGSGTLVRFQVEGKVAYGVLTAAHVLKSTPIIQKRGQDCCFLGLMKPSQEVGVACLSSYRFRYFDVSITGYHGGDDASYRPDMAFVLLGIDQYPQCQLFDESEFYDMDSDYSLPVIEDPKIFSGFFRGASNCNEMKDGFLNARICLGGGEKIRFDDQIAVQYWEIPNTSRQTIRGASGAAFWRFRYNEDGFVTKSFGGVVIAESLDCSQIEAMSASYVFEKFLPGIKKEVQYELSFVFTIDEDFSFASRCCDSIQEPGVVGFRKNI